MKRGDIAIASPPGSCGKPRPVLIMQDDAFVLACVTVLPFTSEWRDAPLIRLPFEPDERNGLQKRSQLMIDKAVTLPRAKIGPRIGRVEARTMHAVSRALASFLGLIDAPA